MARQYASLYLELACGEGSKEKNTTNVLPESSQSRRVLAVACETTESDSEDLTDENPGDPGALFAHGRTWAGACSLARHLRAQLDRRELAPGDVFGYHALALVARPASARDKKERNTGKTSLL